MNILTNILTNISIGWLILISVIAIAWIGLIVFTLKLDKKDFASLLKSGKNTRKGTLLSRYMDNLNSGKKY